MRKHYSSILKQFFYTYLVETRAHLRLTQAEMAQLLVMDDRSDIDLDHGKCSCSALTPMLFLLYCCTDPMDFLSKFRTALETEVGHVA